MPGKTVKTETPKRQRRSFFMSQEQYEFLRNGIVENKFANNEINKKLDKLLAMPPKVEEKIVKKTGSGITTDEYFNGSGKLKIKEGFLQSGVNNGVKNNNVKKTNEKKQPAVRVW